MPWRPGSGSGTAAAISRSILRGLAHAGRQDLLAAGQDVALRARGFDLYSELARREALSGPSTLMTSSFPARSCWYDEEQSAFLMLRAVYRAGAPIGNVQERRAAFAGVAYAAYRMSEFLDTTQKTMVDTLALRVFDQDQESGEVPFHSTRPALDWDSAPLHPARSGFRQPDTAARICLRRRPRGSESCRSGPDHRRGLTISLLLSSGFFCS